jgi:hypothetical protein
LESNMMVLRSDRTFRTQKSHKGYAAEGIVDAEGRVPPT